MSRLNQPGMSSQPGSYPSLSGTPLPPEGTRAPAYPTPGAAPGRLEAFEDRAQEWMSEATHQAEHAWDTARHQAGIWGQRAANQAGELAEQGTAFLRRNPVASLLALFGLGCMLGFALRRGTERRF